MGAADLARKKCKPCEGGVAPLNDSEAAMLLGQIKGWQLNGAVISKTYEFANYYQTMAFVNAVAWLVNTLGRLGIGMKAGEVILSGALAAMSPAKAGDNFRVSIGGLGSCSVRFA